MPRSNWTKRLSLDPHEARTAWLFCLPLVAFVAVLILVPVAGTLVNSFFHDVTFMNKSGYAGLRNYVELLSDAGFWQALRFTLLFVAVSVPLELGLGMAFALVLNAEFPLRGILRACVLIPWAVPAAVSARTWQLIFNYSYGLANFVLLKVGLSDTPVNWLGTKLGAFSALVLADVWKTTPFAAIILLAGMQAVPRELYAQARVDRANFVQIFFRVTLPLMRPVIIAALLFRTIDALRVFDMVYVLTGGGPGGATNSLSLYAYKYFLSGDIGYGSAVSVIVFLAAFGLSILYVKAGRFQSEVIWASAR